MPRVESNRNTILIYGVLIVLSACKADPASEPQDDPAATAEPSPESAKPSPDPGAPLEGTAESPAKLAVDVRNLLAEKCYHCHGEAGAESDVFVLDHARLVRDRTVVGSDVKAPLAKAVESGSMPLDDELSAARARPRAALGRRRRASVADRATQATLSDGSRADFRHCAGPRRGG